MYNKFMLILFLITQNWKILNGLAMLEWINKLGYIHSNGISYISENEQSATTYKNMDEAQIYNSTCHLIPVCRYTYAKLICSVRSEWSISLEEWR